MRVLWLLIILCLSNNCFAQNGAFLSSKTSLGFLLAHKPTMNHMVQNHASSFELSYVVPSSNKKKWHQQIKHTRQGVALYYINSGFDKLGSISSLYGFMDFPLYFQEKGGCYFRFGSGLSYVEKRFDRFENLQNVAIGTHLNLTFLFGLTAEYNIGRMKFGVGTTFAHSSSGAFKLPNLGVNIPMIDLTIGYKIKELESTEQDFVEARIKKNNLDLLVSSGPRSVSTLDSKKYFIHTLQLDYTRYTSPVFALTLGSDLFYNTAVGLIDVDLNTEKAQTQLGAKGGALLQLDQFSLYLQSGIYLKGKTGFSGTTYQRFGGKYLLNDKFIFNFSLKTHLTRADNFELGFGYRI